MWGAPLKLSIAEYLVQISLPLRRGLAGALVRPFGDGHRQNVCRLLAIVLASQT